MTATRARSAEAHGGHTLRVIAAAAVLRPQLVSASSHGLAPPVQSTDQDVRWDQVPAIPKLLNIRRCRVRLRGLVVSAVRCAAAAQSEHRRALGALRVTTMALATSSPQARAKGLGPMPIVVQSTEFAGTSTSCEHVREAGQSKTAKLQQFKKHTAGENAVHPLHELHVQPCAA